MGMFTHLGGIRLGTIKEGAANNCGAVLAAQTNTIVFAADGTVTTLFTLPAGAQITSVNLDTTTIFNAATTNTLKLGTTSGGAELMTATAIGPLGRAAITTTPVFSAWMIGTHGCHGVRHLESIRRSSDYRRRPRHDALYRQERGRYHRQPSVIGG